jgi:hypothetical protein
VACVEPSDRVIVASFPVTPEPAVAGPLTGGQIVAHEPLQFDFVAVSGTNQYKVKPLAFVTTVTPPTLAVFSAFPVDAGAPLWVGLPDVAGVDEVPELPHPAAISPATASPAGASHLLVIAVPRSLRCFPRYLDHVAAAGHVQVPDLMARHLDLPAVGLMPTPELGWVGTVTRIFEPAERTKP